MVFISHCYPECHRGERFMKHSVQYVLQTMHFKKHALCFAV